MILLSTYKKFCILSLVCGIVTLKREKGTYVSKYSLPFIHLSVRESTKTDPYTEQCVRTFFYVYRYHYSYRYCL